MDITYFGHSSFQLKGRLVTLVTDPYDSGFVGLKYPKGISAEIVTVSHSHADHNKADFIKDVKKIINGPGEYEVSGVSIIGYETFHDDEKGIKRGKNTVYLIEMDELRIVHLGDLGHKFSESVLEELGSVDILMIPVGGFYTIDSSVAAEIVRSIEPSFTIPMHYKEPGMKEDLASKLAPVDTFLKEVALPVERVGKFSIKKGEINEEEQKVVVMDVKQF